MELRNAVVLAVAQPGLAADWFCSNFGFQRAEPCADVVVSGNLAIQLEQENAQTNRAPTGLAHVALNAYDIDAALEKCMAAGLAVDSDHGKPYFNPQIWGTGTRYFNIAAPFGVTVEVCQRLDKTVGCPERNIEGLEHIGVFVESAEKSLAYYTSIGFEQLCPLVVNEKAAADIHCVMVGKGDMVLEIFSAENSKAPFPMVWSRIDRIVVNGGEGAVSAPDGERIEFV